MTLNRQSRLHVERRSWEAWPPGRVIAVHGDGIDWTLEKLGWRTLGIRNSDGTVVVRQRYRGQTDVADDLSVEQTTVAICCWMSGLMRCVQPLYGLSL